MGPRARRRLAAQFRLAASAMRRPSSPSGSTMHLGAEMLQHAARCGRGLPPARSPSCARRPRPASSTADFTCADGTGAVVDRIASRAPRRVSGNRPPSPRDTTSAPMFAADPAPGRIGRSRSEASPSNVAVIGRAGDRAHHQPAAGAGIAEIEHVRPARQSRRRRRPCTRQSPRRPARPARRAPASPCRCGARPRLPAGRRSRFADGQRAEDQRPMRDRLVARHADAAPEGPAAAGGKRAEQRRRSRLWSPL